MARVRYINNYRSVDWNEVLHDVKFKAFTAGYTELYSFLNDVIVDHNGWIKNDNRMNVECKLHSLSRKTGNYEPINKMDAESKLIVKQARKLGLTASFARHWNMHMRKLVG